MEISQVNDLQQGWLNLGVAGAALFVVLVAIGMIVYVTHHCSKSANDTNERWSNVVTQVAKQQDNTLREICNAHAELQRETNGVLREVTTVLEHIKVQVSVNFNEKKTCQNGRN